MSADDRVSREVAHRVFATEFEDATFEYQESDEDRAPKYVVTPGGARINRLFVVGVLTAVEPVGEDDVLRARVVDPTGAFVVYAGQYQPEALAALEDADTPSFVAVTGKANTFTPEDSDLTYTSIRPESVATVDAETRDRWVVSTAEKTLARVRTVAEALERTERDEPLAAALEADGVPRSIASGTAHAISEYGTSRAYLGALRRVCLDALRLVTGAVSEVNPLEVDPDARGETDAALTAAPEPVTVSGATPDSTQDQTETEAEQTGTPVGETGVNPEEEPVPEDQASSPTMADDEEGDGEATPAADMTAEDDEGDFYELDDAEREAVESEYGVEFASGEDIPDAGIADIDPEADTPGAPDTEDDVDANSDDRIQSETTTEEESESTDVESTDSLEDVVVEAMIEMGDGDSVDRAALINHVASNRDVDTETVESAIQDALMSGRCYESGEDELTPI